MVFFFFLESAAYSLIQCLFFFSPWRGREKKGGVEMEGEEGVDGVTEWGGKEGSFFGVV